MFDAERVLYMDTDTTAKQHHDHVFWFPIIRADPIFVAWQIARPYGGLLL